MSGEKSCVRYMGERTYEDVATIVGTAERKAGYSLFIEYDDEGNAFPFVWGHDYAGLSEFHKDPFRDCSRCKGHGRIKVQSMTLPPMPADAKPTDAIPWVITETQQTCPECRGRGMSDDMVERLKPRP